MEQHWLIKSEPSAYSFARLVADTQTSWDGVRNYQARNNLRAMKRDDLCLYYHSNEGKEIVGIAKVSREHYPDPTAEDGDWSSVGIAPVRALARPVSLDEMRAHPVLGKMEMFRRPRLSVSAVTADEFDAVLALAAEDAVAPPGPAPSRAPAGVARRERGGVRAAAAKTARRRGSRS